MKVSRGSYAALFALLATATLTQCKGRTTDNVIPTGETAEVVIDSTEIIVSEMPDSVDTAQTDSVNEDDSRRERRLSTRFSMCQSLRKASDKKLNKMKFKSFLCMAAAGLMLASCRNNSATGAGSASEAAKADSLMYYFGQFRGIEYKRTAETDTTLSSEDARHEYLRGVQAGLNAVKVKATRPTTRAFPLVCRWP